MVVDDQGGLLPGASVTATHLASGRRTEALTDSAGRFFLPGLSVGSYDLTVHLDGFRAALQSNIVLALGQRLDLSFRLAVGGVAETITVTGAAPLLQTTSAEVAEVVRNQQVVNLPLNGRQFLQLALLTDNVVVPPGGTRGAGIRPASSSAAARPERASPTTSASSISRMLPSRASRCSACRSRKSTAAPLSTTTAPNTPARMRFFVSVTGVPRVGPVVSLVEYAAPSGRWVAR